MENERPPISSVSDYPNASFTNSPERRPQLAKQARQRQEAVVSKDQVMRKKQNAFRRVQHRIVEGNSKSLLDYIVDDVVVPTLKSTFVDVISNGADILMYGEPRHGRPTSGATRITRGGRDDNWTPYRNIATPSNSRNPIRSGNSAAGLRDKLALDDFVFTTRTAANDVLDRMSTLIDDYGMVSVLNLYDFCDMTCPFTYDDYVWTDLSTVAIKPVRDGWLLSLPTPHLKG